MNFKSFLKNYTSNRVEKNLAYLLNEFEACNVSNPYFLIDLMSHYESILKITEDQQEAIYFLNKYAPLFQNYQFSKEMYLYLRGLSIKSGMRLNENLRNFYREKFSAGHSADVRIKAIYEDLAQYGFKVVGPSAESIKFSKETLVFFEQVLVTREVDGVKGNLNELIGENATGGVRFFYQEEDLPVLEVLGLLEKLGIMSVVNEYLGRPILRNVNAWHTCASVDPSEHEKSSAAQSYHFDNDIPSGWLKVFIYLSDVDRQNGPHIYVPGSHIKLPKNLRRDGRFSDIEIHSEYGNGAEILGSAGTIIIADTQGFHKGAPVISGGRTILQLEFSNSLIGAETPKHKNASFALNELKNYDERFKLRYVRDAN